MSTTDRTTRTPQLTTALICCAVAALAVTALAVLALFGAALAMGSSSAADRTIGTAFLGIGVVALTLPAVLMWVGIARLLTRPPHGARLLLGCLRALGGLLLVVGLPTLSRGGNVAVIGAVLGIALALLGVAQLLSAAVRPD